MTTHVEYDNLAASYRQVVLMTSMGHRCGYVSVPVGHPWHGKDYHHRVVVSEPGTLQVQESNPIGTFLAAAKLANDPEGGVEISYLADVHGGITYANSGGAMLPEGWWFGFDAAHYNDDRDNGGRPLSYMMAECEKLEAFLKAHAAEVEVVL